MITAENIETNRIRAGGGRPNFQSMGGSLLSQPASGIFQKGNDMYPTLEQVEKADHLQLCRWQRFLPSPGSVDIDSGWETFDALTTEQIPVINRICQRVIELGGFTPEINKLIGW